MNTELMNELKKLLGLFPRSFINANLEVILIPRTNTYFSLEGVQSRRDIIAKLLMWCSRTIAKGRPFRDENRNNAFRELNKRSLNHYLGTLFSDEDIALIYQRLGNGINPELAYRFIDSGFDMEVLDDDQRCPIHSKA
ncbi:hypothetical protein EI999_09510 [Streptococcus suis]|uniref:hypothetical protein n=1 Tax=Streptococcus suis TaxID=1307 RepID=UPI000F63A487|nr:hypothetical protein [Streptococcus suis]NQL71361.1 hypothetical protein [Streptococcus suis]RRR49764.1 hypothetical protein EI999_09510 [Streptococcus suis]HEL2244882.1 hypothetical protein [Streptococcus suis]HEL2334055.1 hypothetical protein [Streptococcus suis]HEM4294762.1 hypothetical protein [Streptococcus suis]